MSKPWQGAVPSEAHRGAGRTEPLIVEQDEQNQ